MSEQKHTPEPWHFGGYGIQCDNGALICSMSGWKPSGLTSANARRIVACVNACAGLEQSFLEAISQVGGINNTFKAISDYKATYKIMEDELEKVEQQRDQLLAALKEARLQIVRLCNGHCISLCDTNISEIEAAIAAAEG